MGLSLTRAATFAANFSGPAYQHARQVQNDSWLTEEVSTLRTLRSTRQGNCRIMAVSLKWFKGGGS